MATRVFDVLATRTTHPPLPNISRVQLEGRILSSMGGHPLPTVTTTSLDISTIVAAIIMDFIASFTVDIAPTVIPNTTIAIGVELRHLQTIRFSCPGQ